MAVQFRTRSRLAALVLSFGACSSLLAAPAAPIGEVNRSGMLRGLHQLLDPAFTLLPSMPLDPALRTEAQKIAADHLARVDTLFGAWIDEEHARLAAGGGEVPVQRLFDAVMIRLHNELALWQVEPGDAEYERATLDVLRTAPSRRLCPTEVEDRFADYANRIARIQAMPAGRRAAALAGERALLGHWGQARPALPGWPDPLPRDAALAWLGAGQAQPASAAGRRQGLALPPVLAAELLGRRKDYDAMNGSERCALQQWWLQESLRQGAQPDTALNAFRYGTAIFPTARYAGMPEILGPAPKVDPAAPRPAYPKLAQSLGVTGTTTVRLRLDQAGKPLQAAIEKRDVKVEAIRGVRPVAFENVFDDTVLRYAMAGTYPKPKDDKPFRFNYAWALDGKPAAPAAGAAAPQSSGDKR